MTVTDLPARACTVSSVRLTITGEIDLASAPTIAADVDAVLPSRPRRLLIDLSGCSFMDAAGIGILLRTHYRVRRDGGRLTLLNPTAVVRSVLHAGRADLVLDIRDLRLVPHTAHGRPITVVPSERH